MLKIQGSRYRVVGEEADECTRRSFAARDTTGAHVLARTKQQCFGLLREGVTTNRPAGLKRCVGW